MAQQINRAVRQVPVWSLYLLGTVPAVLLVVQLFAGALGVDPVRVMELKLGKVGLQFLVAGLAVTPLRKYCGVNLIKFRRAIGLLSFFYIALHLSVWLLLDIQLLWGQILTDIAKRPYITIGMAGFILMLPLALTSNNLSVRKMGATAWRRLQKLVYFAGIAGGIHYVMIAKNWQAEQLLYLAVIVGLLALRIQFKPQGVAA